MSRVGAWELLRSTRTGASYWHNSSTRSSLWHDATLPAGWAWSRASDTAPREFTNLLTGARQSTAPAAAAVESSPAPDADPPKKRARVDDGAGAGGGAGASDTPIPAQRGGALVAGRALPRMPALVQRVPRAAGDDDDGDAPEYEPLPCLGMGFCPEAPPCLAAAGSAGAAATVSTPYFGAEHLLVLRQVCRVAAARHAAHVAAFVRALQGIGRDAATAAEEGAQKSLHIVDVGAGGGASTAALLEACGASAQVFSVDLWDTATQYYADQLAAFGAPAAAIAAWADGDAGSGFEWAAAARAPFAAFCARFWDFRGRVVPARYPAAHAIHHIDSAGVAPSIVWLDADLSEAGVRATLDAVWARWLDPAVAAAGGLSGGAPRPPPIVAGGGWDLSEGVRDGVTACAVAHGLSLHVEEGRAWTFATECIKETRNAAHSAPPATAADAELAEALRVRGAAAERDAALRLWQSDVFAVIERAGGGDDVAALAKAVGDHGGRSDEPWVDVGGEDKRHLNPLMRAAKAGRTALVTALIDVHGAGVNVQAARSSFTGLHLAAYEGHVAVARVLLERGANPTLVNKFGETAKRIAEMRGKHDIVDLMTRLWKGAW